MSRQHQRHSLNLDPDDESNNNNNYHNSSPNNTMDSAIHPTNGQDPLLTMATTTTTTTTSTATTTTVHVDNNNNDIDDNYSPLTTHLKTYTAGEDKSRLAAAAKALGLRQARQPRRQVRQSRGRGRRGGHGLSSFSVIPAVLLDTAMEDARIRSIYSSHHYYHHHHYAHDDDDDDDYDLFFVSPTTWDAATAMLEGIVEEEEAQEAQAAVPDDGHGSVAGGDLVAAVLGIIKGMVGPAILYLPHGFATAGYATALPIMFLCTAMFLYSSKCLLDSWKSQQQPQQQPTDLDHHLSVETTPLTRGGRSTSTTSTTTSPTHQRRHHHYRPLPLSYPELAYRSLGVRGESLVKTGIALMQSGVCLTYLIFVPQNLHQSVWILTSGRMDIPPSQWLLVMVAIQVPLSWLRDIRKLTLTNLLANGLILYGLLVCLGYAVNEATTTTTTTTTTTIGMDENAHGNNPWQALSEHFQGLEAFRDGWYLFIGTSVLLFEGSITLLVPLQEAVHTDEQRAKFPAVYQRVILSIICFYCFFGLTNWMAFGNSVRTVLTTSLPATALSTTVQLAYSVAVIFTFPLQNFPALEIACRTISEAFYANNKSATTTTTTASTPVTRQKTKRPKVWYTQRNVISSCLVCFLAVIAVGTMNSLDKVVSLMGSLLGCPIAFVFPPLIHSHLVPNLSPWRLWLNRLVAGLGCCAMVMASFTTLLTWN